MSQFDNPTEQKPQNNLENATKTLHINFEKAIVEQKTLANLIFCDHNQF